MTYALTEPTSSSYQTEIACYVYCTHFSDLPPWSQHPSYAPAWAPECSEI